MKPLIKLSLPSQRGYTLIELLLALLIYSIVALIVTNSLSNILTSRERNDAHEIRLAEIQLAMSLLERDLEQIINRPISTALGQLQPALFQDTNPSLQRIEFTRTGYINPLAAFSRSTLARVGYQFKNNALVRLTWPTLDRIKNTDPSERIILSQINKMQWQFYDPDNKTYTLWPPVTGWMYNLPRAIQLTLTLKDKGQMSRLFILPENNYVFMSPRS